MASKYDTVYMCDPLFRTVGHMNLTAAAKSGKAILHRGCVNTPKYVPGVIEVHADRLIMF